ncbi:hypothetical protein [Streptomyces sp. NPDC005302]|uniref:hypothetical protein n=1 Tax=Streptomyces sp. NPDC005302 TaxID=3154675 RepID=UPI0033AE94FD
MRQGSRWTTVTDSEFDHEFRGLEAIREKLPDGDPWRAWSNFTFTAQAQLCDQQERHMRTVS